MKICVLRRDGENVNSGMAEMIQIMMESFFGERELFLEQNKEDFTQMLTFKITNSQMLEGKIISFIREVSEINPLYAVRIKE